MMKPALRQGRAFFLVKRFFNRYIYVNQSSNRQVNRECSQSILEIPGCHTQGSQGKIGDQSGTETSIDPVSGSDCVDTAKKYQRDEGVSKGNGYTGSKRIGN
jgi:hypothetical protein